MQYKCSIGMTPLESGGGGERFPYLVDVAVNPAERGLNRHVI